MCSVFTYLTQDGSVSLSVLWKPSPSVPTAIIACHEVQVYSNTGKFGQGRDGKESKERKKKQKELTQLKFKLINGKRSG